MPPKLTSKNIFDVVFEQLPADAFIDTGPASLREELMLEAAGLAGGAASIGSSNAKHGGRGGASHFRRLLLPESSIAAASASVVKSSTDTSQAVTAARAAQESDVLDDADGVDGEGGGGGASAPPPYAPSASNTAASAATSAAKSSLFRRVDDDDGVRPMSEVTRLRAQENGSSTGHDDVADFAMQMDAEDDAVKEAMRYAKLVAAVQAEAAGGGEGRGAEGRLEHLNEDTGEVAESEGASALLHTSGEAPTSLSTVAMQGGSTLPSAASVAPTEAGDDGVTSAKEVTAGTGVLASSSSTSTRPSTLLHQTMPAPSPRSGPLTAAEQLALMPPGLDRVYTGACVMYRHPKGFGFISPDLGGPDVYFINDGITMSFTKLALRAFYLKHNMPLPPSVAAIYHCPKPTAQEAKEEDEAERKTTTSTTSVAVENDAPPPPQLASDESLTAVQPAEGTHDTAEEDENTNPAVKEEASPDNAPDTSAAASEPPLALGGILGDAPAAPAVVQEDVGDYVSVPPTTAEELARAETAANLLTTATAQLLQHQVDQSFGGGVRVGERMSFVVTRNHAGRGGSGRLLRAEFIRGVPSAHFAMPVEQSWFAPLFPGAIGRKSSQFGAYYNMHHLGSGDGVASASSSAHEPSSATDGAEGVAATLVRYTGCVRTYDAEDQRGYLRCDETSASGGNTPDVVFHAHSVLWDLQRCPPLRRQVKESMRVAYSVCGTERNGKYIATLITTPEGEPLAEENMTFADNVLPFFWTENNRRRGRDDAMGSAGGGGGAGGGGNAGGGGRVNSSADGGMGSNGDGVGGDRKRAKAADEDLLLFEDDDYPYM